VDAGDIQKSYLYQVSQGQAFERYNYFEQLKSILIDNNIGHPRFVEIDLMFNAKRESVPSLHIINPSETLGQNSLGIGEGEEENRVSIQGGVTYTVPVYTRRFKATYDVVIVSDNSNEVVALYSLLKTMVIATLGELNLQGLENILINGTDLTPYDSLVPKTMYMKVLRLSLEYTTSAISIAKAFYPENINFEGTATK
jgi:hypothetical protein